MNNDDKAQKLINTQHCIKYRIFNKQLAAIEMMKVQQKIDKPLSVGFSVLELSKLHVYRYHLICIYLEESLFKSRTTIKP